MKKRLPRLDFSPALRTGTAAPLRSHAEASTAPRHARPSRSDDGTYPACFLQVSCWHLPLDCRLRGLFGLPGTQGPRNRDGSLRTRLLEEFQWPGWRRIETIPHVAWGWVGSSLGTTCLWTLPQRNPTTECVFFFFFVKGAEPSST